MTRPLAAVLVAACVLLGTWLMACGGGGSMRGARDAEVDAPREGGADADAAPTHVGFFAFTQSPDGGAAFAGAFGSAPPPLPSTCTVVDAGDCTTATCRNDGGTVADSGPSADGGVDAALPLAPNPGRLTVTGGVFGAGAGIDPDMIGTYLYPVPGFLFSPGDQLGVAAAGNTIAGFAKQTVAAPPTIELTAPPQSGGVISISTGQPLTVSWKGGKAGDQLVLIATALLTSGSVASMTCTWDGALATAIVPSEALRPLAAANALAAGVSWYQLAQTRFAAGVYATTLSVYVPRGAPATFQ